MAFVHIHLAILARRSGFAATAIAAREIFALTTKLAWIRFAFVDLGLTQIARVAWMALARERIVAIDTETTIARRRLAIVDICFTRKTCNSENGLENSILDDSNTF